uniref:ERAP1-like C-terminal domain-containing protein n=1 Tax=Craspedostauros australis TaxID=1486917 RepID=A0A7R9ZKT4_9STRA|mmetsp:Transcript_12403/g.34175  ORF Transcript_12403/g.34175 Transcript_12403/m.34175 type:complete len:337 (+) Transcript_12403:2-1012(+)
MRVQCTSEMYNRLRKAIETKELQPADRVGLVMDSYALVKAGKMKPEDMMKLLASYSKEDDTIVWQGLTDALGGLEVILSDDDVMYPSFLAFAQKLVLPLVDLVGWTPSADDKHLTGLLRGNMVALLKTFCYKDEAVASEADKRCKAFLADPSDVQSVPTDIKTPVFKIYLKNGGEKEYNEIKAYYATAKDNAERKHVLNSLGATPDDKLKLATMEWTTSGAIKLQDFFYAMGSVGRSSKRGREISWQFFQDNFDRLKTMLGASSPSLMNAVVVMCAGGFCSIEKADEIDAFFKANPLPNNSRRIAQMTENMRANGKFLAMLQASDLAKAEFWTTLL